MINPAILIGVGIFVGIYSGIMGLGGGTVMIPVLVLLLGFTQHQAVGTSLAVMIPPVTLPAVIEFYRKGHVDLRIAMWIALGFVGGAFLGGFIANKMNDIILRLVYVGGYTLFQTFGKQHLVRSIIIAGVLTLVAASTYAAIRAIDARQTPANTIL